MREDIIRIAKENGADIVGFAPASRFSENDPIFKIFPGTKTVIGLAFRVLRGIYRGVEEGSTFYQYTTMAVENMEETVMPMAQLQLAMALEAEGFLALPQRRHQQIMAEKNSTNPEVAFDAVWRGRTQETQMDFAEAAVLTGLGEIGLHGAILTDEFGPFVRVCFVLTDAEIRADIERKPMTVVCGTIGNDEHSVGLREIIDIKHGGIEKYGIKVHYLGTSVPVEKLVNAAIELDADAILASTIISHDDIHYKNIANIDRLAKEMGVRDRLMFLVGGTQITPEIAVQMGADAGFGRGTKGIHDATFLVERRRELEAAGKWPR